MSSQLVIRREGEENRTVVLASGVTTIGRLPENDLVLPHREVSRRHADLRVGAAGVILTDLGSSNGTFVGGRRLPPYQPRPLAEGETVRIGPFDLVHRSAEAGEPAAPSADEDPTETLVAEQPRSAAVPQQEPAKHREPARSTYPPSPLIGPQSRYLEHLPVIFHDGEFLGRFLLILETLWEPLEQRQDHLPLYFDPRTCPSSFLPWLAGWLALSFQARWPEARRRALLAEAMELYRWRGTRYGLVRMLEVCAGVSPTIVEEPGEPHTFHISIPPAAKDGPARELIDELVRAHKPAHAGYVLEWQQ